MTNPYAPSSVPPAPPRPSWVLPLIVAAAIVVAATTVAGWALNRGDDAAPPPAPTDTTTAKTIVVSGTLDLTGDVLVGGGDATTCSGWGGYDDIQPGATVVVTNPAGTTIGVGELATGKTINSEPPRQCQFAFRIEVPAGLGFYGVEVSHRGRVQFTEADAPYVKLTLG